MIATRNISQRIQRRMERLFLPSVNRAIKMQIKAFTANLREGGINYAKGQMDRTVINEQIAPALKRLHVMSALTNANYVYGRLKKIENNSLKYAAPKNSVWTQDVIRYFRLFLLEKAVLPITETTKANILKALERSINEGLGVEETIKIIENSDLTLMRARRIVRTETVRAVNFGGLLGAFESNLVMEKKWSSAHDARVRGSKPTDRHSHLGLNGQQVDLLQPFIEPRAKEQIQFPGDPEASGGNTINCRCALSYIPKRDENGRLIRKPGEQVGTQGVNPVRRSLVDFLGGFVAGFAGGLLLDEIFEN